MIQAEEVRTYCRQNSVVFRKTNEEFGGLSNMAPGFPLEINGISIRTSEALYQACRFPHHPEIQRLIIEQRSPMTAKMKGKPHRKNTRRDWDSVRVNIMRWCIRVKLAQNWSKFGDLLLATGSRPIVEESKKDDFWGAKGVDEETLVGMNVLGRLLMELREQLKSKLGELSERIETPEIDQFLLFNKPIGLIEVKLDEIKKNLNIIKESSKIEQDDLMTVQTKKLIEVALPLDAINRESAKEKSIRHGHPSTLHLWWARRPLASCRAVLFASLVDDPSSHPDQFPTEEDQEKERKRLFAIIEELVKWENINNEKVLQQAKNEILKSTNGNPPPVLDPFCGGGSIPLEAKRLGLEAHASDLNPVAVLINKAMIEIPPKFANRPPVRPNKSKQKEEFKEWKGAQGLAEDVRFYGEWMKEEAFKSLGHLYPQVDIPKEHGGGKATVIAWIWARRVKCPNPACGCAMPLVRSFDLSTKKDKHAWVEPMIDSKAKPPAVSFTVKTGNGKGCQGTVNRKGARCVVCNSPVSFNHVRSEGKAGRMDQQLMAIVAEGSKGRIYLSPDQKMEEIAFQAKPKDTPESNLPDKALGFRVQQYGMLKHRDLFTPRQLVALTTFSDLVLKARVKVIADAQALGWEDDYKGIDEDGTGPTAYGDAVSTYLAFGVDRASNTLCTISRWTPNRQQTFTAFARQALPMTWDFPEVNPFAGAAGDISVSIGGVIKGIPIVNKADPAKSFQADATIFPFEGKFLIVTDPPYYDNIGYADLSDFFYVWLRKPLKIIYPTLFSTLLVPKEQELIASPFRHGNKDKAESFFLEGMVKAIENIHKSSDISYPFCIFYAFKQAEIEEEGILSTGWATFLQGLINSGFAITGTWPMRTELSNRMVGMGTNALASSILLVCKQRNSKAPMTTRKEFLKELKQELPKALKNLQHGNIAPVDLAQASIGPGMAVFSRYSKVVEADGNPMKVRTALQLINQVLDEVLAEQESEYDGDTRWAVAWFEQYGHNTAPYGIAETLSTAKNTSVNGLVEAGILESKGGKVRLLERDELSDNWDPATDDRMLVWEVTQHLIRAMKKDGETGAAKILQQVGGLGEVARDLAYRLFTICERKGWAEEALAYNSLVVAWPQITQLAQGMPGAPQQTTLGLDT